MCFLSDSTVRVISMAETYNKALSLNYTAFGFPPSVIRLQLESHYTYTRVGLHSPNGTGLSQRRWNSFQRNNFNTGGQMLLSITHMTVTVISMRILRCNQGQNTLVTCSRCEKSKYMYRQTMSTSFFKQLLYCGWKTTEL